uniref:TEPSIN adaptor related protein complex 4 accessory protein n=1 Tax=Falco tinnunculus TaxID=100819 RepID=A0A8C4TV01_FALTI
SVMAAPLRDRLSFLSRLPVLLRGTADDDVPCPGYLFEEIAKISHESPGSSQCLLEYLLRRLQSSSCRVKLKVLKILLHTCAQGSPQFVLQLKRNACFIREAAVFTGPPDPLHGNSLNQKVRAAAQVNEGPAPTVPSGLPRSPHHGPGAVLAARGLVGSRGWSGGQCLTAAVPAVSHQPGLAGGGWEEADSGHSSQDSSQGNGELSRTSDSCSKSGSDSQSGASRELAHVAESRVDADSLGDCVQEVSLVSALTRGARVFLTGEEAQHFIKECGLLNCEVVLELLGRALENPSDTVRMRSMCAISSLMCSDLLSLEQILAGTRQHLQQLSHGSPGPVANRATKVTPGASPCPLPGMGGSCRASLSWGAPSSWEQFCACPRGVGMVRLSQEQEAWGVRCSLPWGQGRALGRDTGNALRDSLSAWERCQRRVGAGLSPPPVPLLSPQILRQFEALCSGQTPPTACPGAEPRALALVSAPGTGDLLAGIAPLGTESILTPLSPVSPPAAAETPAQRGAAGPGCTCGGPGDTAGAAEPPRSPSLFAGMELVARPGAERGPPEPVPPQLRDARAGAGSRGQRSAFAFLNM